jgi:hypothetical protein
MARYLAQGTTATALAGAAPVFNITGASGVGFKPRWLRLGSTGGTTPAQIGYAIYRTTAAGTETTLYTGQAQSSLAPASAITGVATAWSTNPTRATNPLVNLAFDQLAESPVPFDFPDDFDCAAGTANGVELWLVSTLGTGVALTWTVCWEE